ncbi:hypothetical protein GCM10010149_30750 [Nonomuraea roseoviolacea subsp. roseoviolacea]
MAVRGVRVAVRVRGRRGPQQVAQVLLDGRAAALPQGSGRLRRAVVGPAVRVFGVQLPMYGTASRISTVF